MAVANLTKAGFLYDDTFDSTDLNIGWEAAPADRWSLTANPGFLRMEHGTDPAYLFFSSLTNQETFVMDVANTYAPSADGDAAGLVVYTSETEKLVLSQYFDSTTASSATYPWMRLVRNYNMYTAYSSQDGLSWNILGTQNFEELYPKFGLFIGDGSTQDMDVDRVRIYTGTKAIIQGVVGGMKVSLHDNSGAIVETITCRTGDSSVAFDMSKYALPFNGSFSVAEADGSATYSDTDVYNIWGGDVYDFSLMPDLHYINDAGVEVSISQATEEFLGYMNGSTPGTRDIQMFAVNPLTSRNLTSIAVTTADYNGTGDYLTLIELAPDNAGSPGTMSNSVSIPTLSPGQKIPFWLRLHRRTTYSDAMVYFGLSVSASVQ